MTTEPTSPGAFPTLRITADTLEPQGAFAEALDHAALDLALDEGRIEGEADVLHRNVAERGDGAGVGIDPHLDQVGDEGRRVVLGRGAAVGDDFDITSPHDLVVEVRGRRTVVSLDGGEILAFAAVPYGRVGLVTSTSSVGFDDFWMDEL